MAAISHSPSSGVVVTGGASGIGRACAEALAEAGRPVALWDLDGAGAKEAAAGAARRFGVAALGVQVDVSDASRFPEAIAESITAEDFSLDPALARASPSPPIRWAVAESPLTVGFRNLADHFLPSD